MRPFIPIVGVGGYARHGKGTVAGATSFLGFDPISLADELKDRCHSWFGAVDPDSFKPEALWGDDRTSMTRKALQIIGTDIYRSFDDRYWIKELAVRMLARVNEERGGPPRFIVPDVRFPNEADFILDSGGLLVFVERPGFRDPDTDYAHASEAQARDIRERSHIILRNIGTPEELEDAAREIVDRYTCDGALATVEFTRVCSFQEYVRPGPRYEL